MIILSYNFLSIFTYNKFVVFNLSMYNSQYSSGLGGYGGYGSLGNSGYGSSYGGIGSYGSMGSSYGMNSLRTQPMQNPNNPA
jgi:peroxin-13